MPAKQSTTRRIAVLLAIVLVVVFIRPIPSRDVLQAQGESQKSSVPDGLTLHVSGAWIGRDAQPALAIEISNESNQDITLNLGMVLWNNPSMFPTGIRFIITDAAGNTRTFQVREPRVAGRVDDYLVPLRHGGSYRLALALNDLYAVAPKFELVPPAPGKCQVRAELKSARRAYINSGTEGVRVVDLWAGQLNSELTSIEIPMPLPKTGDHVK